MKSQALPMKTIALIIIGLLAFSVLVIFFFSGFAHGKNGTSILTNMSNQQVNEAKCSSTSLGSCPSNKYCNPETGECVSTCSPTSSYPYACPDNMNCVKDCDKDCGGKSNPPSLGGECQ
jgi:hypothetical protein